MDVGLLTINTQTHTLLILLSQSIAINNIKKTYAHRRYIKHWTYFITLQCCCYHLVTSTTVSNELPVTGHIFKG